MDFSKVESMFAEPGKDYRPAPLWTWNAKVNHEDIDRMLKDFKDQGFGGAFIHPRPGLITEYLSEDWFELWRYSVEKGKELGLDIWIYDENSYPSGFAGGHVQRAMPESYDHPTAFDVKVVDALPEDCSEFSIIFLKEGDQFKDITAEVSDHAGKEGSYYLYKDHYEQASSWTGGRPYVDLMYPGVTEKFIEITMSGYEKEFGKELGPVVKGVFTDEPRPLQWTPAMYEEFQKDWGYDLKENLPLLIEETGDWKRLRFQYRSTQLRLFIEHWAKPWDKYCREKGLLWTGHYWEHGWPGLGEGVDNMAMYQYHRMPAIDMLFNGFDEHSSYAQWGNIRSVKELRSVANQMGYTRTLCESYGGGGWAMTFEDFKRLADWEYALGVNFMNQHYSNITIEGARKLDYPDFFTGYSPWAEDYKTLNDHVARLSLTLSQGEQNNEILILEPTSTVWMYYSSTHTLPHLDEIGGSFTELLNALEHKQLEYDLGCETMISDHGKVKNGKFVVGQKEYATVILPENMEVLLPTTAKMLEDFARKGGRIVALSKPTLVNGTESESMKELWESGLSNISTSIGEEVFANANIKFEQADGGNLYHQRRDYNDGTLLFLANVSKTKSAHGKVVMKGMSLKEYDTMDGNIFLYPCTAEGGNVAFEYDIPAAGHLLLFAPSAVCGEEGLVQRTVRTSSDAIIPAASEMKATRLSDNYLTLDYCTVTVDGETFDEAYVADACRQLYRHFDMANPWETAIQYKDEAIARDTIKTGVIDIEYRFDVADDFDYSSMKLVCERPWLWTASINGNAVTPLEGEHPLDARNGAYMIGEHVRKGTNTVILHLDHMSVFAEVAHAFICGDFSVENVKERWTIRAPREIGAGTWKDQGMPFYSWKVAYSKDYDLPASEAGYVLKLNSWEGTVAEVFVNGEKAGVIAYKPYEADITPFLKDGLNSIEVRCVGSLVNLYGPHYTPRQILMGPHSWYGAGKRHPASEFVLNGYGLHNPFDVILAQ